MELHKNEFKNKKVNLLLAEDNEIEVQFIKRSIKDLESSINLIVANDGVEAVDFLSDEANRTIEKWPDLVLLDLNMPRKGGLDVLKEIKTNSFLKSLPVIIFSTSNSEKDIKDCYDNHANCYIQKPVQFAELKDVIARIESFWCGLVEKPINQFI